MRNVARPATVRLRPNPRQRNGKNLCRSHPKNRVELRPSHSRGSRAIQAPEARHELAQPVRAGVCFYKPKGELKLWRPLQGSNLSGNTCRVSGYMTDDRFMRESTKPPELGIALDKLRERARDVEAWLRRDHATEIQHARHLDEGTRERVYWHHGYAIALRDALRLIVGSDDDQPTKPC